MTGHLLPNKDDFEKYVVKLVIAELEPTGNTIAETLKGDTRVIPFDWLLRLKGGTCIGLEVVRAEDEDQGRHVEQMAAKGETVITGMAEMPWDSLRRAIAKKLANVDRYREALNDQCPDAELHLAVTSGLQELHMRGDLGKQMDEIARIGLSTQSGLCRETECNGS